VTVRVSQIAVTVISLDEFDAPQQGQQIVFVGDKDGTAIDKIRELLDDLEVDKQ